MPRPKKDGAPAPKKRSRQGCWPCKARKIKCGEEKPACHTCVKQNEQCDYSLKLNWDGRSKRKPEDLTISNLSLASPTTNSAFTSPTSWNSQHSASSIPPVGFPFNNVVAPRSNPTSFPRQTTDEPSSISFEAYKPFAESSQGNVSKKRRRSASYNDSPMSSAITTSPSDLYAQSSIEGAVLDFSITPQTTLETDFDDPPIRSISEVRAMNESIKFRLPSMTDINPNEFQDNQDTNLATYGFDQGRPDVDLPRNDDSNALTTFSPSATLRRLNSELFPDHIAESRSRSGFGFGLKGASSVDISDYYLSPVAVRIPRALEPLPTALSTNPMNLLYFHHFLNHTARVLVPHDCPENPFRYILPQLAMSSDNLLNLLLAYSACHRARLLDHREPVTRIAMYVSKVFPSLRLALADTTEDISDANLATAIMLASLEIISPNAFEVPVSWQDHLSLAREMIIARGGFRSLGRQDKVSYFLSRWFAYLDVLGALSGSRYDQPLQSLYDDVAASDANFEIDCLLGFTTYCVANLAKVAELARQCDSQRIDSQGTVIESWQASEDIMDEAQQLESRIRSEQRPIYKRCKHESSQTSQVYHESFERSEMVAVNDSYHEAGLIHLHRRVFNESAFTDVIQALVSGVIVNLEKISPNSAAEACMIFPMVTAGAQARLDHQREYILQRMLNVESLGLAQAHHARKLLQKVWKLDRSWESLVDGEFFG